MIFVVIRDRGIGQTLCSFEHVSCYYYYYSEASREIETDWPLNVSCEHVHNEWMMLMTRPCVDACSDRGPVQTSRVTMWNNIGRWDATEKHNKTHSAYV